MLVWLQSFLSRSELESQFQDDICTKTLLPYLESVIKHGYLNNGFNVGKTDLDVSKVSCQRPINLSDNVIQHRLSDDVNKSSKNSYRTSYPFTVLFSTK